jgi:hypothetical protein
MVPCAADTALMPSGRVGGVDQASLNISEAKPVAPVKLVPVSVELKIPVSSKSALAKIAPVSDLVVDRLVIRRTRWTVGFERVPIVGAGLLRGRI